MNELFELIGNLQDCPWSKWRPGTLRFCESHVCSWIVTPAETWSNIGYFLVAFYLLYRGWKIRRDNQGALRTIPFRFGIYALITAVCSTLYHSSQTFIFETFDLTAMFFLGIEMILQNLSRLGWMRGNSPVAFAGILFTGAFITLLGTEGGERLYIFTGLVTIAFFLETVIFVRARRLRRLPNYRSLLESCALFAASYACWWVDYTGLVCNPDRHTWSGHAFWHLLNAGCFITLSRFYSGARQLSEG
ncbi:MAG: hypothetical protein H7301_07970 [Cryobacterium sp.]|nr:hypothetical protein [Oligoflexia bacterium]